MAADLPRPSSDCSWCSGLWPIAICSSGIRATPAFPRPAWFFFRVSETAPQILFPSGHPTLLSPAKGIALALRGEAAPFLALPFLALGVALFLWGQYAVALDLVSGLAPGVHPRLGSSSLRPTPRPRADASAAVSGFRDTTPRSARQPGHLCPSAQQRGTHRVAVEHHRYSDRPGGKHAPTWRATLFGSSRPAAACVRSSCSRRWRWVGSASFPPAAWPRRCCSSLPRRLPTS